MDNQHVEIAAGCYGLDGYGSGIADHSEYAGYSAVVLKSTSLYPMAGNSGRTFYPLGNGSYWNRVGLRNPGIDNIALPPLNNLRLSLYATSDQDWQTLLKCANALSVQSVELNVSCPAVQCPPITDYDDVLSVSEKPVYLKISAFTSLDSIPSGIAGIVCGNTIPHRGGGISGSMCKKYNVELTRHYSRFADVIGCGGISNADDMDEYRKAGATRVQVGSQSRLRVEREQYAIA